jgi:hypothetical protein
MARRADEGVKIGRCNRIYIFAARIVAHLEVGAASTLTMVTGSRRRG